MRRTHPLWTVLVAAVVVTLVGLVVLGTFGTGPARAYWAASSSVPGSGGATLGAVGTGNTPSAAAAANDITVTWAATIRGDGSDVTGYTVQRYNTSNVLQTTLAGCSGSISALSCTEGKVPDGLWTYAVTPVVYSWSGTQSARSAQVRSDATAPAVSLARTSTSGGSIISGSTLYYRGAAAGSFTLTMTVTDGGSTAASAITTALTPLNVGWMHLPSNVSTPAGGPYVSNPFSWLAGATGTVNETVIGYDQSGNGTNKTLSYVDDSTGPAGGALSHPTGVQASRSVTITTGAVTDAASGVLSRLLQRRNATFTYNSTANAYVCGTYGSWATTKTSPATSYVQTLSNNTCYQYQYLLTDNVGNTTTVPGSGTVKIRAYSSVIAATGGILDYYRFTETTGTTFADSSVATTTNTGTWSGGPALGAAGALVGDTDPAATFDGVDDYGQISRGTTGNANYAIEFWFRSAGGLGTSNTWYDGAGLVDADTTGVANDFGVSLMLNGRICAGTGNPDVSACTPSGYADNAWHHVVVNRTATSKALAVYVDGTSRVSIATGSTAALSTPTNIRFGSLQTGANYFTGSLDEVAIYSATLSTTSIATHYQANQP